MRVDKLIAGVDEAGCGPLAGPVVAAAVILHPDKINAAIKDSKLLTAKRRDELYDLIINNAIAWAIGKAEAAEIDAINILQARLLAMQRAITALGMQPDHIQVDGNFCPTVNCSIEAIVDGDSLIPIISAASILAKVTRDREMLEYDALYPKYGFAKHKGYGTKQHLQALREFGVSPIHRLSFKPVKVIAQSLG